MKSEQFESIEKQWEQFINTLNIDQDFPPSDFTFLLFLCALHRVKSAKASLDRKLRIAELGAKEGAICTFLSPYAGDIVATELHEFRLSILQNNVQALNRKNITITQARVGEWFPRSVAWHSVDLVLANPPSIPCPSNSIKTKFKDKNVLFSGVDGRADVRQMLSQWAPQKGRNSEMLIVAADYVLDNWFSSAASDYGLNVREFSSRTLVATHGNPEWELKDYIVDELGWKNFIVGKEQLSFKQVAYLVW